MNNIKIETDRLYLRELKENDRESLWELFSDPIAMTYFPSTKTVEEVDEWIGKNLNSYQSNEFGLYLCVLKETLAPIGYCGFILQQDVDGEDEVEIGYGLIRNYWHKGFASEAAIGCKKYGFESLKTEKLISLIRPENKPSINVAVRNGMQLENKIIRWNNLHGVYSIKHKEYLRQLDK